MRYTLKKLIEQYCTDPYSTFQELQYSVRVKHERLLARIIREHGDIQLQKIRTKTLFVWHSAWREGDKVAMAHSLIGQLRLLVRFGATMLEDRECNRLFGTLGEVHFEKPMRRYRTLTMEQVVAHRKQAHWRGWNYMALGQALQFDLLLGQKHVIGEWVPLAEPGVSDTIREDMGIKWIAGLRWEWLDQNLTLCRTTNRGKKIAHDLKLAPMVLQELADLAEVPLAELTRGALPESGPIILCEINGYPYTAAEFRRKWRIVAKLASLPDSVTNSVSRPNQTHG